MGSFPRGRHRVLLASGLLTVALAASAGIGVGALVFASATPESLSTPVPVNDVPVSEREFEDRRTVEVGLTLRADTVLAAPGSGRITAIACQAGAALESGRSSLAIDGRPVVNLATAVPLWRDLARGDRGDDVHALQAELARLGHELVVDGVVRASTVRAYRALLGGLDGKVDASIDAVERARVLWLPATPVSLAECTVATGADVVAGDKIATVPNGLAGAAITHLPDGLAPGDRVLVIDGASVPIESDGRVTSAEALAAIAATPTYAQAVKGGSTTLTASLALANPVTVSVVPPGALYDLDGEAACVSENGIARAVQVLGSELGQSFVNVEEGAAPETIDLDPAGALPCR